MKFGGRRDHNPVFEKTEKGKEWGGGGAREWESERNTEHKRDKGIRRAKIKGARRREMEERGDRDGSRRFNSLVL